MELRLLVTGTLLTNLLLVTPQVSLPTYLANLNHQLQQRVSVQNWERAIQKIEFKPIFTTKMSGILNDGVKVAVQPTNSGKFMSVKDFGAVGNGTADDRVAIQRAIDAVSQAGGGVVFFPEGTYKVTINPSTLQAITIRAKVTLQGAGNSKSKLKLADKQGNYNSILAGEKYSSDLSKFAMYDLAVDGNGSSNPVKAEADYTRDTMRHALRIYVGSKIHIERCKFTNQTNVNTITVNGYSTTSDIWINDNTFESIGGGSVDYDHSTIYVSGKRIQISKNYFTSKDGAGTKGARTAIETHGDKILVNNNKISGFTFGMNITGIATSSDSQSITGNVMQDVYGGIVIWSYFDGDNTDQPALVNCLISNNKITLNPKAWLTVRSKDDSSSGITLESNSNAPINRLKIVNNHIQFKNSCGSDCPGDRNSAGIYMWRTSKIETKNLNISGNTIENSPGAGINISMTVKSGELFGNTIINPGISTNPFHDDNRSAIIVFGDFENVQINNNLMLDNQAVNTMKVGILGRAACTTNCQAIGNVLRVSSGAKLEIFRSDSGKFEVSS